MPRDDIVHRDALGGIGTFTCEVSDPRFCDSGPTHAALFVFPRTAVTIAHAGAAPLVADRTTVVLYNRGAEYRRGVVSPAGDVCDWFAMAEDAIVDAITPYDPSVVDRADRPYAYFAARVTQSLYLRQRRLRARLSLRNGDALELGEARLSLLREVVALAHAQRGRPRKPISKITERRHAELAHAAQAHLAKHFARAISLESLAQTFLASPFHLSRVFRERTGKTIHRYLTELRLSSALERIGDPRTELSRIAIDVGFATHSHFSEAFRATYGVSPSALRTAIALRERSLDRGEQDPDSRP